MTPDAPVPAPPARGNTLLIVLAPVLIAFVAGLAVMAALFRFGGEPAPAAGPGSGLPATVQPAISTPPVAPPGTDMATLAAREQALAARLDALDARLRTSDADAREAASYAGRSEAMMLAFGARRALERGQPLGFIDGELRRRLGAAEPEAVATVVRASAEPVTLSTSEPDDGWLTAIQRELSTLVIVRKQDSPSPHPRERLARARRLLAQGHVEAALAEVARLPGAQGAESWMSAASRYIDTRRALDRLEEAAIKGAVQPVPGARTPAAP